MQENRLYLIFEFLTMDLKKYMDTSVTENEMISKTLVKSYTYQILQGGAETAKIAILDHFLSDLSPLSVLEEIQERDLAHHCAGNALLPPEARPPQGSQAAGKNEWPQWRRE